MHSEDRLGDVREAAAIELAGDVEAADALLEDAVAGGDVRGAVAIGLQSKGTAIIHRADLQPLDNLELFGMAPLLTLDSYHAIGRNAAGYALGRPVKPVPTSLDNFARAKLIVKTTLLHARETEAVVPGAPPVELALAGA